MPSKLVDKCWHAFICETREYQTFCKAVFGGFLHHESSVNTSFSLVDIAAEDIKSRKDTVLLTEAQAQLELILRINFLLRGFTIGRWLSIRQEEVLEQIKFPYCFTLIRRLVLQLGISTSQRCWRF